MEHSKCIKIKAFLLQLWHWKHSWLLIHCGHLKEPYRLLQMIIISISAETGLTMTHHHDTILRAVWKERTWVTAVSFPGKGRVGCWLKVQGGTSLFKLLAKWRHEGTSLLDQFLQKNQFYTTGTHSQLYFFWGYERIASNLVWRLHFGHSIKQPKLPEKERSFNFQKKGFAHKFRCANLSLIAVGTM